MHTDEQIEKSGEHHDKINDVHVKLARHFAVPLAYVLVAMLCASIWVAMGVFADGAQYVSEWARKMSQHSSQEYAWLVLSYGWKFAVTILVAFIFTVTVLYLFVEHKWPK